MAMMTEPHLPQDHGPRHWRRWCVLLAGAAGFGAIVFTFWLWWPFGVALGLILGACTVLALGLAMHTTSRDDDGVQATSATLEQLMAL